MYIALGGTLFLACLAALAVAYLPLTPSALRRLDRRRNVFACGGLRATLVERIRSAYPAPKPKTPRAQEFLHNIQLLRVISAFAIVYIHLEGVLAAFGRPETMINVLRFGTDLFVVVAGFLSAHLLTGGRRSGGAYLRNRLIRIVPLYVLLTLCAFLVGNLLMHSQTATLQELLMSLTLIPYGPYPVLYPAWTLEIIMAFSMVLAGCLLVSRTQGVYFASAFFVAVVLAGQLFKPQNPTLIFYTNPMVLDFALGCAVFKLARLMPALPRRVLIPLSLALVLGGSAIIVLRPFVWPDLPRFFLLGLPVSAIVLGAVTFERIGFGLNSPFLSFLANCTYAIYLTHWFTNIVSEKLVFESSNSILVASLLLVVTPVIITYLATFIHLYVERPATKYLTDLSTRRTAAYSPTGS